MTGLGLGLRLGFAHTCSLWLRWPWRTMYQYKVSIEVCSITMPYDPSCNIRKGCSTCLIMTWVVTFNVFRAISKPMPHLRDKYFASTTACLCLDTIESRCDPCSRIYVATWTKVTNLGTVVSLVKALDTDDNTMSDLCLWEIICGWPGYYASRFTLLTRTDDVMHCHFSSSFNLKLRWRVEGSQSSSFIIMNCGQSRNSCHVGTRVIR